MKNSYVLELLFMIRMFAQICQNAIYNKTNADYKRSVFKVQAMGSLPCLLKVSCGVSR